MKMSVIVPVYNVEKYIGKCIESIKAQTLKDFECLIINDGTKDNSVLKAKEAIGDDSRFVVYDKENGGLSDARNYGTDRAKGEYVCYIDSDDYVGETLLEDSYNMAKKYDSDICCFDMYYVYDDGRKEISKGADFEVNSFKEDKTVIFINNSANNKIYRTSFMKDKRFIKGMWYEDLAIVPTWIAKANNVSHVDKPLYYYLQREGSISHSADKRAFDIYKAIDNIRKQLSLSDKEVRGLYFDNCLIMTTLRIKDMDNRDVRLEYYSEHLDKLNNSYPEWYKDVIKEDYSIKQKMIFFLFKNKCFKLIDWIYNR